MIGSHRVTRDKINNSCDVLLSVPFSNTVQCKSIFYADEEIRTHRKTNGSMFFPNWQRRNQSPSLKREIFTTLTKRMLNVGKNSPISETAKLFAPDFVWSNDDMINDTLIQPAPCSTTDITDFVVRNQPRPHLSFQVRKN